MHRDSIVIVTPALADANNGNWQTARRWAQMLRPAYRVSVTAAWSGGDEALMIALHARRSAASVLAWREAGAQRPLLLALTGTDLYRDIDHDPDAQRSLSLADRLIVLNELGALRLPPAHRDKARVVLQSCPVRRTLPKTTRHLRALMVGHLREEKNPQTYFRAARRLTAQSDIHLDHIGAALDPVLGEEAAALAAAMPHYRWLGALPHAQTRRRIQAAHVLVHASRMEGGAHVVIEAIRSGTPVLASRIDGNLGLLGADYAGSFAVGDDAALAALLRRARCDGAMLAELQQQLALRAHLFAPEAESATLHGLVAEGLAGSRTVRTYSPHKQSTDRKEIMNAPHPTPKEPRLTSLSHGGGCGCKIAPGVLSEILKGTAGFPVPKELLVGIETADDAAVYQLNDEQALIATTDFFMPIVDDPFDFGRIAATNAISDVYAMGGKPILALALVGMPINVLSTQTIGRILEGGASVCRDAGIPIAGGHTIDSVEAIYGLVALGLVHPKHVKRNAGAKPGDVLVLGKPLGVGVMSAALKKGELDDAGYAQMIATTTKLNTAGPDLAALPGVHALTDVTGFGLAGHALEMARGSGSELRLDWSKVPLMAGVREMAGHGFVTGASGRNWAGYGEQVVLPAGFAAQDQALLSDPQTSGGLLVACAPEALDKVLAIFVRHGFEQAAVVGEIAAGSGVARLVVS